ncbi:MAG: DUF6056 family protein, partial [Lachnospiraceae bacterium]|nr:DUF6056 family protein [Lachnospiraceae bacterium]
TILLIQYMPAPRGGIFWFTGISVYTLSFGFSLLALLLAIRFTDTGKLRYIVCCTLLLIYIGGSGYPEFVLSAMIIFFHGVYSVFMKKTPSRTLLLRGERAYSPKRGYLLLIPLALECISFLFSAMSPGNAKRSGSEGLTPGAERLVNTVTGSLYKGLTDPVTYIKSAPLIIIFVILVVVFTAETWNMEEHKGDVSFRRPYIVLPVLYLVYSFTYAPEIYAGDDVSSGFSGGVYDTYYFTFMICLTIAAVYMTCFVKTVFHKSSFLSFTEKMPDIRVPLFLISMIFCLVLSGRLFDNTVDYTCIKFAASGGLSDFEAQMRERIAILEDENIRDAVVPEMNDSQGPFMHMPLLSDPTAFTNKVTAEFYGKDSVIAVPREEFNK